MAKKNRTLTTNVTVVNPETNLSETYGPDSDLPEWAHDAITNPKVWDDFEDDGEPLPDEFNNSTPVPIGDLITEAQEAAQHDAGTTDPAAFNVDPDNLADAKKDDLVAYADALGIDSSGTKAEIAERIQDSLG